MQEIKESSASRTHYDKAAGKAALSYYISRKLELLPRVISIRQSKFNRALIVYYGVSVNLAVSVLVPFIVTDNGLPVPVTLPLQLEKL